MEQIPISSPTELSENGLRGPVSGVTRISGRVGIVAILILGLIASLIVYGIWTAGKRRAATTATVAPRKAADQRASWFEDPQAATPLVTPPPLPLPTPAHVRLPSVLRHSDAALVVPTLVHLRTHDIVREQIEAEREAHLSAAENATISVPISPGGAPIRPNPSGIAAREDVGIGAIPPVPSSDQFVATVRESLSPYTLRAGSVVPATLITGINADLPGTITAQVRSNVFDSLTGTYVLVPRGAQLIGTYDSRIVQGQRRVLVTWNRIIFDNVSSIDLPAMQGVDPAGYAGFGANVNEHLNKAFTAAFLMSIISAGAQLSQPQHVISGFAAPDVGQTIAGAVGSQLASTSSALVQRQLGLAPTLEVPPGYDFDVLVNRDIVLSQPYSAPGEEP